MSTRNTVQIVAALVLICVSAAVRADGTLTLQLPPSQVALEMRAEAHRVAAERAEEQRAEQRRAALSFRSRALIASRGGSSWRGARQSETVVGRLGRLKANTGIFRDPDFRSKWLATPPPGTYVAIRGSRGNWYGLLMADGSTGWVPAGRVSMLDYNVVSAQSSESPTSLPAPSGDMPQVPTGSDIYPRSSTPFFTGDANALLTHAYQYMGVPYVWGGNTFKGIDCSGFVRNVFAACGYSLPRLGSDQMAYGIPVPVDQLQAGDRLYFERRTDRVGVKHTGLYIGNGYFIHSSSSQHGVAINNLTESLWHKIFVCARR